MKYMTGVMIYDQIAEGKLTREADKMINLTLL